MKTSISLILNYIELSNYSLNLLLDPHYICHMQFVFITYFFYVMFSLWVSILFYLKVYMHTPYMPKVYIYTWGVPALFKGVDSDRV